MARQQLRTLVRNGWLHPMAPRVYSIAGVPPSIERRLMLGLLSLGPRAVVSHEAAARLHGFDRLSAGAPSSSRVPRGAAGTFAARFRPVHSTRDLPPIDRVRAAGFPCTSATRTIIDLTRARISKVRLEAAIDSAVRSQSSSPVVLAKRTGRARAAPVIWGAPTAR